MGRLFGLAKNFAGEKSLASAFGRWVLAVSRQVDALQAQNVVPDGTYDNQLLIWNGTEWVPEPDYSAQTTWYINASTGSDYAQVGGTTRALSTDVPYIEVASNAAIIAGMNGTLGP